MIPKNKKLKSFHLIFMSILLISAMAYSASLLPTCSAAAGGPTVLVDPAETVVTNAAINTQFKLNVTVANITAFVGAQFTLSWNSSLMNCTKIEEILYHKVTPEASWSNIWQIKSTYNNTAGTANYAFAFQDNKAAAADGYAPINVTMANYPPVGKLALAVLTFNVTKIPDKNTMLDCNLTLSKVTIGDINAIAIPVTLVNGHYVIYGPPETSSFNVVKNSTTYVVTTVSNASVVPASMGYAANWTLNFNLTGADGTTGYVNVTIPKNLISVASTSEWNITVNGVQTAPLVSQNTTHWFLYITTSLSTKSVKIIGTVPEFPLLMAIPLLIAATLVAAVLRRRRQV